MQLQCKRFINVVHLKMFCLSNNYIVFTWVCTVVLVLEGKMSLQLNI